MNIKKIWDARWNGSEQSEKISPLGRIMFKTKQKVIAEILSDLNVKNMIEVGCGLGYTLSVFENAGIETLGIDISEIAVEVCKNKGLNVKLQNLENETGIYDLVSSDGMLEHFLNFEPFANHLMRISSRYVLLIQPNHNSFWGRTAVYFSETIKGRQNVYEYNYRIDDFIEVFKNKYFIIRKNIPVFFDIFRILLFEKLK